MSYSLDQELISEPGYVLISRGVTEDARLDLIEPLLRKKVADLPPNPRTWLEAGPRVLWKVASPEEGRAAQVALAKIGCASVVETVNFVENFAVPIPDAAFDALQRRFDATRGHLAIAFIEVRPAGDALPASMIRIGAEKLAAALAMPDGIDVLTDRHALVYASSMSAQGLSGLREQLNDVLRDALGAPVTVGMGVAVYPDDSEHRDEVLSLAYERHLRKAETSPAVQPSASELNVDATGLYERAFSLARGRWQAKILDIPVATLAPALSVLPARIRERFIYRVPANYPTASAWGEALDAEASGDVDNADQALLNVTSDVEFAKSLKASQRLRQQVMAQLEHVDALPTLPNIALEVFNLANSDTTSAKDLTAVIEHDPALTARLLSVVNSSFFGFSKEVTSVKHAIVILGTQEITNLAMGLATSQVFKIKPGKVPLTGEQLWDHAVGVAAIARHLAEESDIGSRSVAFTAGLLHDLGKVFLIQNFPEEYAQVYRLASETGLPTHELEAEIFGTTHAELGEHLAAGWNLPTELCESIGRHHDPMRSEQHSTLAALVGLADQLHQFQQGSDQDHHYMLTLGHAEALKEHFADLSVTTLDLMTADLDAVIEAASALR